MDHYALDTLSEIIQEVVGPLTFGCVFPIVIVWLIVRLKINESKNRMQIVMAALEKNPNLDIEELIKKMAPKKKMLKEKLLTKLLWTSLTTLLGIGFIGFGVWLGYVGGCGASDPMASACIGLILLGVGIALFINYHMSKKMLAKEIEAEEKRLTTQE